MIHIKEYNQFSIKEGKWFKKIHDFFDHKNEYDKIILSLIDRINEIFNFDELSFEEYDGCGVFNYRLEETDSESGFITITIMKNIGNRHNHIIQIDDDEIECGDSETKSKLWNLFWKKWKEKKKLESQKKLNRVKKKCL